MTTPARNVGTVINEMIDHIDYVSTKLKHSNLANFQVDRDIRQIVERSLEIISEAARHLPSELKKANSEIPWRQVEDFGNILRHVYFDVDSEVVWEIATRQLAPLKQVLLAMRDQLDR